MQSNDQLEAALSSLKGPVPDGDEYARLSTIFLSDPIVEAMRSIDPFSDEYRATAMQLYRKLRRLPSHQYDPETDELSQSVGLRSDIWRDISPWNFSNASVVAEFLMCWGHIMRLLDLPTNSNASIVEYGPGSGQLILFLARIGLDVHAVDIDQWALDLISAQATAMGLDVKCDRAQFGEGFEGKKFDRIIFFEAFHHAWHFDKLLDRLTERISPGGLLILCGEPIVKTSFPGIPLPWGPRLDGLSVFCIRHFGWMELGFSEDFLTEAFRRKGWLISDHHIEGVGRASTYVARRAAGTVIKIGAPDAISARYLAGWEASEGSHRWTVGGIASFPNPAGVDAIIRFSNLLSVKKNVSFRSGDVVERITLPPGSNGEVTLRRPNGPTIDIECDGHRPADIDRGSSDTRKLGIAIREIEFRT